MTVPNIGYRTESFAGSGIRDAVQVIAYETFELGNTDILEYILEHHLTSTTLKKECGRMIRQIDSLGAKREPANGYEFALIRNFLRDIYRKCGIDIRYVLWLTTKESASDPDWYGKYLDEECGLDVYETGPVILSDLDTDGRLYGYADLPFPIPERLEQLRYDLKNVIDERESNQLSPQRASFLDNKYLSTVSEIQRLAMLMEQSEGC